MSWFCSAPDCDHTFPDDRAEERLCPGCEATARHSVERDKLREAMAQTREGMRARYADMRAVIDGTIEELRTEVETLKTENARLSAQIEARDAREKANGDEDSEGEFDFDEYDAGLKAGTTLAECAVYYLREILKAHGELERFSDQAARATSQRWLTHMIAEATARGLDA